MLSVFWGMPVDPEDYNWVLSEKVGRIIRKIDGKIYTSVYEYQHRRDPIITTFLDDGNGLRTALFAYSQDFRFLRHGPEQ
jgi:hypothetical protein